jgi:hypothetical protein
MEDNRSRPMTPKYTKPAVVDQGDVHVQTKGGDGTKIETGENIVWGVRPFKASR